LDPTYKDRFGRPLFCLTIDFHHNELTMCEHLSGTLAQTIERRGANQVVQGVHKGHGGHTQHEDTHSGHAAITAGQRNTQRAAAPSWAPIRIRAQSIAICRAGTCRTCLCRARPRFRRTPATIRPEPSARSPTGRRRRSDRNISRTRDRSSMRSAGAKVAAVVGLAVLAAGRALAGDGIDPQDFKQVERGRYLAIVGDCAGCHTLPGSGHDFAGGRPLETPFGTMLAPNITPDPDTGIGSWTDDE